MCVGVRTMGARFWELHSHETIFIVGGIISVAAALLSLVAGIIVGYLWLAVGTILIWDQNLAPFSWLESNRIKWALVVLAPLTVIGICVGVVVVAAVYALGAPYFFWRSIQKDVARRRKQIEEGDEYVKLDEPHVRNWLIGVPIYYLCLVGFLFGMWVYAKSL